MPDADQPLPAGIGAPATRALTAAGHRTLRDLTRVSEAELRAMHGVGPTAVARLRDALTAAGLTFRPPGAGVS